MVCFIWSCLLILSLVPFFWSKKVSSRAEKMNLPSQRMTCNDHQPGSTSSWRPVVISWNTHCVFTNAFSEHLIKGHGCNLISRRKGDCNIFQFKYQDSIGCSDPHCFVISSCEVYYITTDACLRICLKQDVSYQWDYHIKKFTIKASVRRMSWVDLVNQQLTFFGRDPVHVISN